MKRWQILADGRLAGQVLRYHTWPIHRQQSVGEHTWQVMRIWYEIWGPMPPDVSSYLLWHDAGELVTGDLPFPVKAQNGELKRIMDQLEDNAVAGMGVKSTELSDRDKLRCKVCDLIEMWEYGLHELALGNQYAKPIIEDIAVSVEKLASELPDLSFMLVEAYTNKRKPDVSSSSEQCE